MLLPALLDALNAPSERVVVEALHVQASIAEDEPRFLQLMRLLLDRSASQTGSPRGWGRTGWGLMEVRLRY